MTSESPLLQNKHFVLIEKALRDEGASHHYLPPARYVSLLPDVVARLIAALDKFSPAVERGAAWTTDAPYRETAEVIEFARAEGVLAVEMEAASLYAFAQAKEKQSSASRTSPTAWASAKATSRKGRRTARWLRSG